MTKNQQPDQATAWLTATVDLLGAHAARSAATLRLADLVAAGHTSAGELAEKAGTAPGPTARLMRYLSARGVFREVAPEEFALTPAAELLRSDNPDGLQVHLDAEGTTGRMERAYPRLIDAIRTGRPVYQGTDGEDFYSDVAAEQDRATDFAAVMGRQTAGTAAALADAHDWSEVGTVLDVGGGNGTLLRTLLTRFPELRGTVLDLPGTADVARRMLAADGLDDRGAAVGGSYFDALPKADVYVLASILLDREDDEALRILGRCREGGGPGARVLCVEWLADGQGSPAVRTHVDLHELVLTGGRLRSREELDELAASTGLAAGSAQRLPTGHLLLEYTVTE